MNKNSVGVETGKTGDIMIQWGDKVIWFPANEYEKI
jgi:hypothetical protein